MTPPQSRTTIGAWLTDDVATRHGISADVARAIVMMVLDAVTDDVQRAVARLSDPDFRDAGRIMAARIGYARDRVAGESSVRRTRNREKR